MKYEAALIIPHSDTCFATLFFDNDGDRYTEHIYTVKDASQYFEKYISLSTPTSWTLWDTITEDILGKLDILSLQEIQYLYFFEVDPNKNQYTGKVISALEVL